MLILTRKKEESIIINENIEIKVVELNDGRVKLGIDAPKEIKIHRKEVYEAIKEENQKASKAMIDIKNIRISDIFKND